ncbi:hypothetical protein EJ05DRAFT_290084 [Pseudovirgaria hyperparasitica]|uniref:Uncharacterized protein n=1 Tax=Pseudovirgaria hyperparasitica TaxID=470096 RepID=A0A6A6WCN4_9PEZI|nr:uncharacterized protein EJ05DRAFT_290084 [Pseudovirgaria hyperparasitica]KAF2760588.1 hypothetical protein EJ05DRAFT_290084 [Pseudovirgaria hyperparasitica]
MYNIKETVRCASALLDLRRLWLYDPQGTPHSNIEREYYYRPNNRVDLRTTMPCASVRSPDAFACGVIGNGFGADTRAMIFWIKYKLIYKLWHLFCKGKGQRVPHSKLSRALFRWRAVYHHPSWIIVLHQIYRMCRFLGGDRMERRLQGLTNCVLDVRGAAKRVGELVGLIAQWPRLAQD